MKIKNSIKSGVNVLVISTVLVSTHALSNEPIGHNEIVGTDVPLYEPPVNDWKEGEYYDPHVSNQHPVALVHGFAGWGRDEISLNGKPFLHFGGLNNDIQEVLKSQGVTTVTPAVGPLSSDWDRACELYAQLTGTRVDYGAIHAHIHEHDRYGRVYSKNKEENPAYIPGLGDLDSEGFIKKINLITHSQGTPTARLLVELLANGSDQEKGHIDYYKGWWPFGKWVRVENKNLSPLFQGGNQWVQGIASFSGANDGSLLTHSIVENIGLLALLPDDSGASLLAMLRQGIGGEGDYDLKLDHFKNAFGIINIPKGSKDTAAWDLSPDGARAINQFATAEDDVYYFSWANNTTYTGKDTGYERVEWDKTNIALWPFVDWMGSFNVNYDADIVDITPEWWKNDGIVSTRSMRAPINGSGDPDGDGIENGELSVDYSEGVDVIRPGIWHFMGELDGYDHWDTLGILDGSHTVKDQYAAGPEDYNINRLYLNAVKFLRSTPAILPPEFENN